MIQRGRGVAVMSGAQIHDLRCASKSLLRTGRVFSLLQMDGDGQPKASRKRLKLGRLSSNLITPASSERFIFAIRRVARRKTYGMAIVSGRHEALRQKSRLCSTACRYLILLNPKHIMPKSGIKIKINVVTVNFWFSFSPRNQFRIFHPPVFFSVL